MIPRRPRSHVTFRDNRPQQVGKMVPNVWQSAELVHKGLDMERRTFLKTISSTAAVAMWPGLTWAAGASSDKTPPNVVLIHVDDLGWRDLGCMGSAVYQTPHIDALAKSGTLYSSAYAAAPICVPSRACLLTGSQPTRHGIYTGVKNRGKTRAWKVTPENNNHYLPKDYPTIGGALTQAGIANAAIGKLHVSTAVPSHGFSEGKWGGYLGMPINYFAPFKLGFLPQDVPAGAYLPNFIREAGVEFLEEHQRDPFFLYFCTYLPHDEIQNEGESSTLNAPADLIAKYEKKIAAMKAAGQDTQGHDNPIYAAMIEETDRSVGVIIDKLDQLGLRDHTLVIFISDNGGHRNYTSNLPLRGAKGSLYEGGIRVPMIASMPGRIAAGQVSDEPISGIDLYPTLCRLMNLKPTDPAKVDGEDLTDLLFDAKPMPERNLFWNFPCYAATAPPRNALRRGDWKIIYDYETEGYELYNLKHDISESADLAAAEPKMLAQMKQELAACYKRFDVTAKLPANPAYNPNLAAAAHARRTSPVPAKPMSTADAYQMMGLASASSPGP